LASVVAQLREHAAANRAELAASRDENPVLEWEADVPDRRPLSVVGVLQSGSTNLWLMEPSSPRAMSDVLHVAVGHLDERPRRQRVIVGASRAWCRPKRMRTWRTPLAG